MEKSFQVSTFEPEDFVIFSELTSDGSALDNDQCMRLFSLNAEQQPLDVGYSEFDREKIQEHLMQQQSAILENVGLRNVCYFDLEIEKLDKWGEDRRNSLKVTLKDLDDQIKELKKQARQVPNMPDRLKCEKERRKHETERDEAWHDYDQAPKLLSTRKTS